MFASKILAAPVLQCQIMNRLAQSAHNWHTKRTKARKQLLDYIENQAKKSEFVGWLNSQYDSGFTEKADWSDLKDWVLNTDQVKAADLHEYAASLNQERDLEDLLATTEAETRKAAQVAGKLTYLSAFKKFAVAIGGAVILEGLLLATGGLVVLLEATSITVLANEPIAFGVSLILLGAVNFVAGILLATR